MQMRYGEIEYQSYLSHERVQFLRVFENEMTLLLKKCIDMLQNMEIDHQRKMISVYQYSPHL